MFAFYYLVVEWVDKDDGEHGFEVIFGKIDLKRCKVLFEIFIVKYPVECILEKLECNLSEKSGYGHFI